MRTFTAARQLSIALLAALIAIAASLGSAFAAPSSERQPPPSATQPPARPTPPAVPANQLARTYREEQQRLKLQDVRLKGAVEFATRIEKVIAQLKSKGKDTTALEAAVASYRTGITNARAQWQIAADALAAHAGFDANGKVTDADQARATLKSAHSAMEQARKTAHDAFVALRKALAEARKANRTMPKLPEPQEP